MAFIALFVEASALTHHLVYMIGDNKGIDIPLSIAFVVK